MTWPAALHGVAMALASVLMASTVEAGARLGLHPVGLVVFGGLAVVFGLAACAATGRK
jgi:hypothetical protein